jgi:regulatory protein
VDVAPAPEPRLEHALGLAWRLLNRRDRTVLEVRRHLEAKGVDDSTADAVVAELAGQGYLDDAGYATRFVQDRRRLDHWGRDRIERRLAAVGVPRALIDAALDDEEGPTELEGALAVLRRRFPVGPGDARAWRSAFGMLVRKGYDPEVAQDAIRLHRGGEAAGAFDDVAG